MGLSLAAGSAVGEDADPVKRAVPAKDIPIEKVEPRERVLERPAASPIITGAAAPEVAAPTRAMAVPKRAPRVVAAPPPMPQRRPSEPSPRRRPLAAAPAMAPEPIPGPGMRPAVDGGNATGAGFGGASDGRALYGGTGTITVPLGPRYGLHVDGTVQGFDTRFAGQGTTIGGTGHLFWRDPDRGLLGLYGHYAHADVLGGVDMYAGGVAGALYLGRWSLDGVAGVEGGGSGTGVAMGAPVRLDVATQFFDLAMLSYYPEDDLKLSTGHSYTGGRHALDLGVEWGVATAGPTATALFAQGSLMEGGDAGVIGGLRLYFGQRPKSLITRHREDTQALAHPAARPRLAVGGARAF